MVLRDWFEGFCRECQVHRVAQLVLKIDGEPRKNGIHRLNFPKTPASVHAEAAVGQLNQGFDVVALQLACRRHFLEFFSHKISYRSPQPSGISLLRIVHGEKPRIIAARVLGRRSSSDYVEDLLDHALGASRLSSPDRHLCQELVYGAVRWQAALDW